MRPNININVKPLYDISFFWNFCNMLRLALRVIMPSLSLFGSVWNFDFWCTPLPEMMGGPFQLYESHAVRCLLSQFLDKFLLFLCPLSRTPLNIYFRLWFRGKPQRVRCSLSQFVVKIVLLTLPVCTMLFVTCPRQWFSGKIQRCHRWAPCSIHGWRIG